RSCSRGLVPGRGGAGAGRDRRGAVGGARPPLPEDRDPGPEAALGQLLVDRDAVVQLAAAAGGGAGGAVPGGARAGPPGAPRPLAPVLGEGGGTLPGLPGAGALAQEERRLARPLRATSRPSSP